MGIKGINGGLMNRLFILISLFLANISLTIPVTATFLSESKTQAIRKLITDHAPSDFDHKLLSTIKFEQTQGGYGHYQGILNGWKRVIYVPKSYIGSPFDIAALLHEIGHIYNNDCILQVQAGLSTFAITFGCLSKFLKIRTNSMNNLRSSMGLVAIVAASYLATRFVQNIIGSYAEDAADQFAIDTLKRSRKPEPLQALSNWFEEWHQKSVKKEPNSCYEKLKRKILVGPRFLRAQVDIHASNQERALCFKQAADDIKKTEARDLPATPF